MERLYQLIARHFSQSQIEELSSNLGIYVPPNSEPTTMARELFSGARRNLRLDVLFNEVYRTKASLGLDLGPNLYELIAGTFNEQEAAELAQKLGFDQLNVGLDASGLIGWNNDNFYKSQKATLLQKTAVEEGKFGLLLVEMKNIRPTLDLTVFNQSALAQDKSQKDNVRTPDQPQPPSGDPTKGTGAVVQYIIYGDHVGGDKVSGDKTGGNLVKDVSISDVADSAISIGGDAAVGTQLKDVQGDVTRGQPPNRDDLLALISQINDDLTALKSELRARDSEEAAETLQAVVSEVRAEKPDAAWIARKLKNVAEIAEVITSAGQFTSNIEQAIQDVQTLFGG